MRIQSIDSYNTTSKGLYFTKATNVLFNKNPQIKYATDKVVKVSEQGSRYIEDSEISQEVKNRFAQIPFINELAKRFDTFIHFHVTPKGGKFNQFEHVSFARISWADYSKKSAEHREFVGLSPVSQELATEKMFKNIESKQFCNIS